MASSSRLFTLSTTPTLVAKGKGGGPAKVQVLVTEPSATIYAGGSDVDSTEGITIETSSYLSMDLADDDELWLVAGAGTPTCKVLTTRTGLVEPA